METDSSVVAVSSLATGALFVELILIIIVAESVLPWLSLKT